MWEVLGSTVMYFEYLLLVHKGNNLLSTEMVFKSYGSEFRRPFMIAYEETSS